MLAGEPETQSRNLKAPIGDQDERPGQEQGQAIRT